MLNKTSAIKTFAAAAGLLMVSAAALAQPPETVYGAQYLQPVTPFHVSGSVHDLAPVALWQPGDAIKEIPKRRSLPEILLLDDEPRNIDPLLALQQRAPVGRSSRVFGSTLTNFAAQGFSGVNPPDTVGDVGPTYYVQMINASFGSSVVIYNKTTGAVAAGPFSLDSRGAGTGACSDGFGDPIVLYDQLAQRWLLSEFSGSGNNICVYISMTSDPTGEYYVYPNFVADTFPDYPKFSVWHDAYYVTTNEGGGSPIYAMDRTSMLQGLPATMQRVTVPDMPGFGFQALTPADVDGASAPPVNSAAYFLRHRDTDLHFGPPSDSLELWSLAVDFSNPANTALNGPTYIPVAEFDSTLCGQTSYECFAQPGSATTLDPLREVVMWRLQYRNFGSHEALVGNFVVDVDGSDRGGIRWFELNKTGANWVLRQEGTYSPDAVNRWMGAIAMDGSGNIALGYNVSDATSIFPGLRYTGRLSGDSAGAMTQGEHTIVAGTAANASNRYGDYSAMSIDPSDDCTFWFTGEYNLTGQWSTQVASFKFDSCGAPPAPATEISGGILWFLLNQD